MTKASKFLFSTDFRQPPPDTKNTAALAEAEARGHARGFAEGQRQVEAQAQIRLAEAQARLAAAMERLAETAGALLANVDDHCADTEELALDFATALGRKLAGRALARDPLSGIAETAAQTFQHLRGVPHLVVRVNDALVESVDGLVQSMAGERGFDGRIVTLGDPEIPVGDVRLEWADGGIVREQARIEAAVEQALAGAFASRG
jgi:flagellar assembly protein FliH